MDLKPFSYYVLSKKLSDLMLEPAEGFEAVFLLYLLSEIIRVDA